ncbi:MAG TPA: molybdopterin-dependent oxidoreductase, partial [Candidatus Glassbacteria bacterium]|nr:molybdopterin-dependent oxidoreductase [Candidatus Glassbacteria bacterium]
MIRPLLSPVLMIYLAAACGKDSPAAVPATSPGELSEYEGQALSTWSDFRENSITGPQKVDITQYQLEVGGLVANPKTYTYADLVSRPAVSKLLMLTCVELWQVNVLWDGFSLAGLLDDSGVAPSARTVVFRAHDGYSTSVPLTYVREKEPILALRMNGVELHRNVGYPLMLIAEGKWGYKWCRWITGIELSDDENFKGFW